MGSEHIEQGLLLREDGWIVLQRDGGGRWRLDVGRRAEKLLGRRVRVHGVRSDFDLLDVLRIDLC